MLETTKAFSSFSVTDLKRAKEFYGKTLGLDIQEKPEGLKLDLPGTNVFIYPKPNHEPASFTVLNFAVDNVDNTVDELKKKGIRFENYDTKDLKTDKPEVATELQTAWDRWNSELVKPLWGPPQQVRNNQ